MTLDDHVPTFYSCPDPLIAWVFCACGWKSIIYEDIAAVSLAWDRHIDILRQLMRPRKYASAEESII